MKWLWLGFVPAIFVFNNSAFAATLEGNVEKTGITLTGGIDDGAELKHSLKLIPDSAKPTFQQNAKHNVYPLQADKAVTKPAPAQPLKMQYATPAPVKHSIPAISSYSLAPQVTRVQTPGYQIQSVQNNKGINAFVPGFEVSSVSTSQRTMTVNKSSQHSYLTTYGGSSTYAPGYEVRVASKGFGIATGAASALRGGSIGRCGVVSYIPGYEVTSAPVIERAASSSSHTQTAVATTRSGVTSYVPGYEVTLASTPTRTIAWIPGHDSTIGVCSFSKNTLSGIWSTPQTVDVIPQAQQPAEFLAVNKTYVEPVVAEDNLGLKATAQILNRGQSSMGAEWDEWYDRVGRAIYSRWQRAEVGAGSAKVRVNVDIRRNLVCDVAEFRPAQFAERDSVSETAFRVTALRAIRDLSQYEIPELPALQHNRTSVTFDIEMTRTVDGPSGFTVAAR